jgi:rhodanese-related sulfurtransferase
MFDAREADRWAKEHFPESRYSIALIIGESLVNQIQVPWSELLPSTKFSELNVWDDFDGSLYADCVELKIGCLIPEKDRKNLHTISDLVEYLKALP